MAETVFPSLPKSWSELSWRQLQSCWQVKMRYGGNADVARAAALLALCKLKMDNGKWTINGRPVPKYDPKTGERIYVLSPTNYPLSIIHYPLYTVTARELSQMAKAALPWFDWPYGDPGEKEVKDDKGKVIKESRDPVRGYVSPMRDALMLSEETVAIINYPLSIVHWKKRFALPQVACNNLTWQQYRSLQAISPQLFQEGIGEDQVLDLQAQFLAHCLVPRSLALLDTSGSSIRLRPHWEYTYDTTRAEGLVPWFRRKLKMENGKWKMGSARSQLSIVHCPLSILYHVCLQAYQTALVYYAAAYPLLFSDDSKNNKMQDALQGEVETINAVMMKAHYTNQQEVYDSNLPFILGILNTMAKEAKQIEAMNARIKRK